MPIAGDRGTERIYINEREIESGGLKISWYWQLKKKNGVECVLKKQVSNLGEKKIQSQRGAEAYVIVDMRSS